MMNRSTSAKIFKSGKSSSTGFSTLELLIVLTVISMVAAIGFTSFQNRRYQHTSRSAILAVHAIANQARQNSISKGTSTYLNWNLDERTLSSEHAKEVLHFPKDLDLKVETAVKFVNSSQAQIVFHPDGSSSGGNVIIKDKNGFTNELNIDWLTGISSFVTHASK